MTSTVKAPKCQAKGGAAACTDPDCPERTAAFKAFLADRSKTADMRQVKPDVAAARKARIAVMTGAKLNNSRKLRLTLSVPFSTEKLAPVRNSRELSFVKPSGGIWMAPESHEGTTAYERLLRLNSTSVRHELKFKDDAKVAVIDSHAGYQKILAAYPFKPEEANFPEGEVSSTYSWAAYDAEGKARRNIDYEAMGKDFDALYVTIRGLTDCNRKHQDKDVSLSNWDFESGIILNPDSVQVTVLPPLPSDEDY